MPNSIITVIDVITQAPVSGASVFSNSIKQGVTDNTGQVNIQSQSSGTFTLSVTAIGYNTQILSGCIFGSPYTALLTSTPLSIPTFILNVNPEAQAVGQTFTFDNAGSPVTVTYTVGGTSINNLAPGTQTITASITGCQPIIQSVDTTTQTQTTVELAKTADTGMVQAKSPQSPAPISTTVNTLPTLTPNSSPEFVAPNNWQGTYFTMTQARLYIGRVFIDELNGLQFTLQNNKIPIYGYASRDYDAIAQGKSLVQGQFTINFVSEGYLYVTLQDYINNGSDGSTVPSVQDDSQTKLNDLVAKLQNPDPKWTPGMVDTAVNNINAYVNGLGSTSLTTAKGAAKTSQKTINNSILGLAGGDFPNAVYQDIGFDIVLSFTGADRMVTRLIQDCHLISNESILDHSGTPILDSYGFIARRLR